MEATMQQRTPAHLWAVGVLSLLWNGFGSYDYVMTRMRNTDYIASTGMNPDTVLAYVDAMPIWSQFGWGLGVWGGLVGAILLLMRNRYAVHAFAASLFGIAISIGYEIVASTVPDEMHQGAARYMPYAIILVGIGQLYYAWRQRAAGLLR